MKLIEYDEKYGFSEEKLVDYEYEKRDLYHIASRRRNPYLAVVLGGVKGFFKP